MTATIVRLPTAAARKVKQPCNRAARAAKKELPRHPAEHLNSAERAYRQDAELIAEMDPSAALVLATAIFGVLTEEQRLRVAMRAAAAANTREGQQVCSWLRRINGTIGDRIYIDAALDRLQGRAS